MLVAIYSPNGTHDITFLDNYSQTNEYSILVNGRLNKVSEFEKIIVKTLPVSGQLVYLKDIARVELGKFTFSSNSFMDGKRASYMQVFQSPGSRALETAANVYATLDQLKKSFPADVDYSVPFEGVTIIKTSMRERKTLSAVCDHDCHIRDSIRLCRLNPHTGALHTTAETNSYDKGSEGPQ